MAAASIRGKRGGARRLPAGHLPEADERDDPGTGAEAEHHRLSGGVDRCTPLDRHGRGDGPTPPPHPLPHDRRRLAGEDQASRESHLRCSRSGPSAHRVLGRDPVAFRLDVDDEPPRRGTGKSARRDGPIGPEREKPEGFRLFGHGRPRSTLIAYWWLRVLCTWISRTALPCRRITSATARGTTVPTLPPGIAFDIRTWLPVRPLTTNPYCFESIFITVSPDTGLSPGTLGHLERRDDRPSPVFQREFF